MTIFFFPVFSEEAAEKTYSSPSSTKADAA
jgi:hypothetical protein